jgi:undecaprenyl-diphosphatase
MTIIEAIILGIIQGLTEFLPVSSSGHIELGAAILRVQTEEPLLFAIVVHGATALSTIVVFRQVIGDIFKGLLAFKWNESWDYATKIIISMIPVGIVGVLFEDQIDAFFGGQILLIGCMLLITSILLTFTYLVRNVQGGPVSYAKAAIIGLFQAMAIMPGISRSGATIASALILKVDKEKATQFSFLMVLPPILGATLLKVLKFSSKSTEVMNDISGLALGAGFLAAFIAGLIACTWMINIVKKGKLVYFAIYCAIIGSIAILYSLYA